MQNVHSKTDDCYAPRFEDAQGEDSRTGRACLCRSDARAISELRENRLNDLREGEGYLTLDPAGKQPSPLSEWFTRGVAKICVYVDSEEELLEINRKAKEMRYISALIQDAGMTEFHGEPTFTCLALEPLTAEQVDPLTGNLPLY